MNFAVGRMKCPTLQLFHSGACLDGRVDLSGSARSTPHLGHIVIQFLLLGVVLVSLNTTIDLVVVSFSTPLGTRFRSSARFRRNQRVASGVAMMELGSFVALEDAR